MCGIVGLLVKSPAQREHLGAWAAPILDCMGDRGADSAGVALFTSPLPDSQRRFSLFAEGAPCDWERFRAAFSNDVDPTGLITTQERHATVETMADGADVRRWLREHFPGVRLLSAGRSVAVYKDIGPPRTLI